MQKIEHIGIAVRDLEKSIPLYETILNTKCYKRERVESEQVMTAFFRQGPNKIELLQAIDGDGPIAKFIEKKGEGMHHIAFACMDIQEEMNRLKGEGYRILNEAPKDGADNKQIFFMHPKDTNGVLIELCQEKPENE